ncbi:uncharacterized protein BJX67DRAFT_385538 [Aspergillus lucknowensis]|uniref:Uncharacterized protein n=1 Tax=Aspergillus lucknowensis TaxID=176173 RepID=A0ABR4LDB0_9EURO
MSPPGSPTEFFQEAPAPKPVRGILGTNSRQQGSWDDSAPSSRREDSTFLIFPPSIASVAFSSASLHGVILYPLDHGKSPLRRGLVLAVEEVEETAKFFVIAEISERRVSAGDKLPPRMWAVRCRSYKPVSCSRPREPTFAFHALQDVVFARAFAEVPCEGERGGSWPFGEANVVFVACVEEFL